MTEQARCDGCGIISDDVRVREFKHADDALLCGDCDYEARYAD